MLQREVLWVLVYAWSNVVRCRHSLTSASPSQLAWAQTSVYPHSLSPGVQHTATTVGP